MIFNYFLSYSRMDTVKLANKTAFVFLVLQYVCNDIMTHRFRIS